MSTRRDCEDRERRRPDPKSSNAIRTPMARSAASPSAHGARQRALGQLEHEPLGLEPGRRQHVAHRRRVQRRHVHVHHRRGAGGHRRARLREHLAIDRRDQLLVGVAHERRGADQPAPRVPPARQRLHRHDLAGVERDDRLEVRDHLAVLQRGGELVAPARPALGRRLHLREPHAHLALAGVLGAVHRHVGLAQQLVRLQRARRRGGDADATSAPRTTRRPTDHRLGQQIEHAAAATCSPWWSSTSSQQHRELVAAHARRDVAPAGPTSRSGRAAATSTASPAAWPRAVVDRLEVVEVEEQHRRHAGRRAPATPRPGAGTACGSRARSAGRSAPRARAGRAPATGRRAWRAPRTAARPRR